MPSFHARDSYLHFKHILHRRIATANRFPGDPTCRLCGAAPESSVHLARCNATDPIFAYIERLQGIRHPLQHETAQRLFCYQVNRPHPSSGYLGQIKNGRSHYQLY
eukprot:scaffold244794_cov28-Tisochrysis_lutea.AAC.1